MNAYRNEKSILYIDPDKKTDSWLSLNRLQLPLGEKSYGLVRKISYADGKVKVQNPKSMTEMQKELFEAGIITMIQSEDCKERFQAEVYELDIRICKLSDMLSTLEVGGLAFQPKCSNDLLKAQLNAMETYAYLLRERAAVEGIDLK